MTRLSANISSVKRLYLNERAPIRIVFGYQSGNSGSKIPKTIARWANELDSDIKPPDAVFWLKDNKAILGFNSRTKGVGIGKNYKSTVFSGLRGCADKGDWEISALLGLVVRACSSFYGDSIRISNYIGNRRIEGYEEYPINWRLG